MNKDIIKSKAPRQIQVAGVPGFEGRYPLECWGLESPKPAVYVFSQVNEPNILDVKGCHLPYFIYDLEMKVLTAIGKETRQYPVFQVKGKPRWKGEFSTPLTRNDLNPSSNGFHSHI